MRKENAKSVCEEMQEKGSTDKEIKEAILGALDDESRAQLNTFIFSYPEDYTFKKDSIYYDAMVSPENHMNAFFQLAKMHEAKEEMNRLFASLYVLLLLHAT
ncbi:hypothetical protein HPULCUR_004931 [Helicostylum pulchrum]|uniref:Uncharacterized protein n=1 Tax=Helicostylum pulchrum TaxID=562976 RepID=A0ABP9XXN0_9FUNG